MNSNDGILTKSQQLQMGKTSEGCPVAVSVAKLRLCTRLAEAKRGSASSAILSAVMSVALAKIR
jgi:hypothetical protein